MQLEGKVAIVTGAGKGVGQGKNGQRLETRIGEVQNPGGSFKILYGAVMASRCLRDRVGQGKVKEVS